MPDLTGKVAIVTGSTKGIGLAIAEHLLDSGAAVVVNSRTSTDVEATVAALEDRGPGDVVGVTCDVGDPEACASMVADTVRRFGRLDILVNNAGLGVFKPMSELTVEEWRLQIDVNLGGVFYCSKAALPHLSATGDGFIINIASLASRNAVPNGTGYNAGKFGVLGLTEAMMLDVRHDDVRVSIVMPGSVDTYFNGRTPSDQRTWRLHADDCALAVLQVLSYPKEAHVSRVEMRPSQPNRT